MAVRSLPRSDSGCGCADPCPHERSWLQGALWRCTDGRTRLSPWQLSLTTSPCLLVCSQPSPVVAPSSLEFLSEFSYWDLGAGGFSHLSQSMSLSVNLRRWCAPPGVFYELDAGCRERSSHCLHNESGYPAAPVRTAFAPARKLLRGLRAAPSALHLSVPLSLALLLLSVNACLFICFIFHLFLFISFFPLRSCTYTTGVD